MPSAAKTRPHRVATRLDVRLVAEPEPENQVHMMHTHRTRAVRRPTLQSPLSLWGQNTSRYGNAHVSAALGWADCVVSQTKR